MTEDELRDCIELIVLGDTGGDNGYPIGRVINAFRQKDTEIENLRKMLKVWQDSYRQLEANPPSTAKGEL